MNIKFALLALFGLAASSSTFSATLPNYEVVAISQTPVNIPPDSRTPTALSAHGWIAGVEARMGQYSFPFRCDPSGACLSISNGYVGDAGINSLGTMVYTESAPKTNVPARGVIVDANGNSTYVPYNIDDCPWLPPIAHQSAAYAINRQSVVLAGSGRCYHERLITFSNGLVSDVPLPADALDTTRTSTGNDINDFGQIVGEAYDQEERVRSFLYDGTSSRWLDFSATHINNAGQIGGYKPGADGRSIPVLYSNGFTTEYPILGEYGIVPAGLNRFGDMVGNARINGTYTGVLMSKGRTKRLQSLLRDRDRRAWTIQSAGDINGSGEIVCSATQKSTGHEFVVILVPVASSR